jgi:hypothetical protein
VTVPVGVPAPGAIGLTVPVKVTGCPKAEGFWEEVTLVPTSALVTCCFTAGLILSVKWLSPL